MSETILKFGCVEDFVSYPCHWHRFYFHGYVQTHIAWIQHKHGWSEPSDLVGGKIPCSQVSDGIFGCKVYEMDCLLYKWGDDKGYIVAKDKQKDVDFAQKKYDSKAICL